MLSLSASDLLDVLHFLLEDDCNQISTAEQAEARDAVRENIYSSMYGVYYKYAQTKKNSAGIVDPESLPFEDEEPLPKPFDPLATAKPPKPFTKASDFDPDSALPFGSVLDAPLK